MLFNWNANNSTKQPNQAFEINIKQNILGVVNTECHTILIVGEHRTSADDH